MYVSGCVLAVPEGNKAAYLELAETMGQMFIEYGALECAENWEDDVEDGQHTDFRKAVAAEPGEKIVFSWIIWPDRATFDRGHEDMMKDDRMLNHPEMPFDGKRMIFGGFDRIFTLAR
jgi:uncharacterized protein YbaA (DUF1428 family)